MGTAAAVVACVVLGALVVFQLALAAGAPWGRFAWGGSHEVLPSRLRIGSAVSTLIYLGIALTLLTRAGVIDIIGGSHVLAWVITGYLGLGVLMNLASRSRPERLVMTPVALVLAVSSLLVALS